ncbi:MAG: hypothetical protein K6B40_03760 [Firmicutes bacterium]|nr:hypothetical protein [Bacillota bacterium]
MKKKHLLCLVLAALMLLSLAACSANDNAAAGVLENGGLQLTVPAEYAGLLIAEAPEDVNEGVLFTVAEKASVEAAQALGQEDIGAGWLFDIARVSAGELHEMLCNDMSGREVMACDADGNYYVFCHPTDVRLVRETAEEMNEAAEQWSRLNEWADSVRESFVNENDALTAYTRGNSDLEIYLNRIAYMPDTHYTVSTLEYGPMEANGFDATAYVEKLLDGVTYEDAGISETPDGEYAVIEFPEDDIRFDFFFLEGKENYIRQTWNNGQNEMLYKAAFADGQTKASQLVNDWYHALAEQNSAGMGYTADDFLGNWAEKIAGRGQIEITKGENDGEYQVNIHWAGSAFESANWTMTVKATENGNQLAYDDATMVIRTYSSETEYTDEVRYENGTGTFTLNSANEIMWQDDVEQAGEDAVFISVD